MQEASFSLRTQWALVCIVAALACLRLCHVHLLWADEDYHLAAALNILHGKIPYRDFWYDKPPLSAVYYLLIGAHAGWPLRLLDAAYVLAACRLMFLLGRAFWSVAEGWTAALLLAFFTSFYLPSAVIPFAADALMLVPHIAAIYLAVTGRPFRAGLAAGVACLFNIKGVFVLAACALWSFAGFPLLVAGFAAPVAAALILALATGAWRGYWEQVWRWGLIYAERAPVAQPFQNAAIRTAHWLGFHAAVALGAIFGFRHAEPDKRSRITAWLLLSFVAAALGWRFAPHYFLQVLPPLVVIASRGFVLAIRAYGKPVAAVFAVLLLVPLIRFGPRYGRLAVDDILHREPQWIDVAMDLDSQHAAKEIRALARPGDTLFVWGYRPDLYVYTRMTSDSRFWDSQPLTGVPADRHLHATDAIYGGPAAANREQLTRSHPTFVVDGLGLLNPRLAPDVYPELRPWMAQYRLVAKTSMSLIYRRVLAQPLQYSR
jgi:hypothetical protein